jgi:phosphotransferase system enzyme I (PtsP)
MITLVDEIDAARALLAREIEIRRKRGRALPTAIRVGAMIETPAAAWRARDIAARVDFLSIGGNDLAQFYFAADRESELTQRRFDVLEPGFLSFVARIAVAARDAGKPITFCGEQAADIVMAAALIGVGIRRFSSPASSIGPFRRLVRSIDVDAVSKWLAARIERPSSSLRSEFLAMLRQSGAAI